MATTLQNAPQNASEGASDVAATAARLPFRPHVVSAVCRRDLARFFTNVSGYVYLVLFLVACAVAAFWPEEFFANNLANLDQLNRLYPYLLLLFIPAITMSVWADERKQGTEELLLTLPASDFEVVLGKYLAAVGIYLGALAFLAFGLTAALLALGRPDLGILLATFIGYALMGGLLIAVGMVASLLSGNVTVAFILGALFCAIPVFAELFGGLSSSGAVGRAIERYSVPGQFRDFGRGVVPLAGIIYFVALAASMLYINVTLLGRRHWAGGEASAGKAGHAAVRVLSVLVAALSLFSLAARAGYGPDLSEERLSTLSRESKELISRIPGNRPVFIEAYLSPEVPGEYVEAKANLINLLRSYDQLGGDRVRVNIVETELFSPEARQAESRFGITPRRVFTRENARQGFQEIVLGVAFTSGPEQVVIPFFDRGLPVEYELTRSIRVVTSASRKKVGILATDANLLGGFDFRAMSQSGEWEVVTELKKQYDVSSVPADSPIPTDLDALVVAQPSSLTQPQIDNLVTYVRGGGPVLLLMDPLPQFDRSMSMSLAPSQPKEPPGGMFGGGPPPEPKGDLSPLLELLGLEWPNDQIVWNPYNPHPKLSSLPSEYVFIASASGSDAFNPDEEVSSGLQEMILLFPGYFKARGGGPDFTPLLRTDNQGGVVRFQEITTPSFLGLGIDPRRATHFATGEAYTLAARIEGEPRASASGSEAEKPKATKLHAIAIADLDFISDGFFNLRQAGSDDLELEFDNVTFILNCVDQLAGDTSFIELRKQRKKQRTLTTLEKQDRAFEKARLAQEKEAEDEANKQLEAAREGMSQKIQQIESNQELDDRSKQIALANLRDVEQRKLDVSTANIEDAKKRKVEESFAEKERKLREIRSRVRLNVVTMLPLPALLLGAVVFFIRSGRENRGANPNRLA